MIILDHLSEHCPPAHSGHIQIEKDEIRRGGILVFTLLAQEGQTFLTIFHAVQVDEQLSPPKAQAGKLYIVVVVFDKQDLRWPTASELIAHLACSACAGIVK
jgi:hypothetical protein